MDSNQNRPKVAALIIGIDGWEKYTEPLIDSLQRYEPECQIVAIDNASVTPYPPYACIHRTDRLCYAAAINAARRIVGEADWYLVLSNDVIVTSAFAHMLDGLGDVVAGKCLKKQGDFIYVEGWCVFASKAVWEALGGWDENFQVSSWEDVDFSVSALEHGFDVVYMADLPFHHLDQRQRFTLIPNYWDSEAHNMRYFTQKHTGVTA